MNPLLTLAASAWILLFALFANLTLQNLAIADGGGSGRESGGGTLLTQGSISEEMVQAQVPALKKDLGLIFNEWELVRGKPDLYLSKTQFPLPNRDRIFELLFGIDKNIQIIQGPQGSSQTVIRGKKRTTVFDVLPTLKFVPRVSEDCEDKDGNEQDATAFNSDPMEICFSVKRLAPKLSAGRWKTQLRALAAHEVAHRLGATESEAKQIQKYLNLVIQEEGPAQAASLITKGLQEHLRSMQFFLGRALDPTRATEFNKTPSLLCDELDKAETVVVELLRDLEQYSSLVASPLRFTDNARLVVLVQLVNSASELCGMEYQNKPERNETNLPIIQTTPDEPRENGYAEIGEYEDLEPILPKSMLDMYNRPPKKIVTLLKRMVEEAQKIMFQAQSKLESR